MNFDYTEKVQRLREELIGFIDEHVYPNEKTYADQHASFEDCWSIPPIMEELKEKAKAAGLWNLFLPDSDLGTGGAGRSCVPRSSAGRRSAAT